MPSEIGKLYDAVMKANTTLEADQKALKTVINHLHFGKVAVSGTPRTPMPTRQGLEASLAQAIDKELRIRLPIGFLAQSARLTSREENGKIIFEASVEVPVPARSAVEAMKEAIDDGEQD